MGEQEYDKVQELSVFPVAVMGLLPLRLRGSLCPVVTGNYSFAGSCGLRSSPIVYEKTQRVAHTDSRVYQEDSHNKE